MLPRIAKELVSSAAAKQSMFPNVVRALATSSSSSNTQNLSLLKQSLVNLVRDMTLGGGFARYPDPNQKIWIQRIEECKTKSELVTLQDKKLIPHFKLLDDPKVVELRELLLNHYSVQLLSADTGGIFLASGLPPQYPNLRETIWSCKSPEDVLKFVEKGLLPNPAPKFDNNKFEKQIEIARPRL